MKSLIEILDGGSAMAKVVEEVDKLFALFANNDEIFSNNQNIQKSFFMNNVLSCQ